VGFLLVAIFSFAQTPAPEVEITTEPSHHLLLENRYVRVFRVEIAARSATLLHRHRHDYMFVMLGATEVSNEVEGKQPVTLKLQDGATGFLPGNFAHVARNLSNYPSRSVDVEFLPNHSQRNSSTEWDEDRGLHILHGGTAEILFAKDGARASEVELQTAGVDPEARSGPQLIVAVSDLVLRVGLSGKGSSNLEMRSGDAKWFALGLTHGVTNVGTQAAKYVIVEFKE